MASSTNLKSIERRMAELQAQLDAGKDQIANTLGSEIVRLHGGLLLDLSNNDLKVLVKYLDIEKAIRSMESDKKAKLKLKETSSAESGNHVG